MKEFVLYIGVSKNFGVRWKQHAESRPWWSEVRRMTADASYTSRAGAEKAERLAIKAERPKYNKQQEQQTPNAMPVGCMCWTYK